MDSLKSGTPAWQFQAVRVVQNHQMFWDPQVLNDPKSWTPWLFSMFLNGWLVYLRSQHPTWVPARHANGSVRCQSSDAMLSSRVLRSNTAIGLWVIWLGIVGCSDQASDSDILLLSSIYCSLYPLGPSIVDSVLLWITGGTAQTRPSSSVSNEWMKCKMNSIPFDKQLSLTQVSQQVKHPNPGQALLSALADYMGSSHWDRHWLKPSTHRVIALDFRKCSFSRLPRNINAAQSMVSHCIMVTSRHKFAESTQPVEEGWSHHCKQALRFNSSCFANAIVTPFNSK